MAQPTLKPVAVIPWRPNAREAHPVPLTQPLIIPVAARSYLLVRSYEYTWRDDLLRHRLLIPCGDEHDGASVPRFVWTLSGITPDGLIRAAALVHDWLYKWRGRVPLYWQAEPTSDAWKPVRRVFTKKEADCLFHRIMREAGEGPYRAGVAYRGVRLAFWNNWG